MSEVIVGGEWSKNTWLEKEERPMTSVGQPVEYKVLVLPDVVEEKTAGGIILAQTVKEREQMRAVRGEIIAVGGNCFEDWNPPIPIVGDRIIFAVNSGTVYKADGKEYRIIHDKEIVMILPEEKEDE